MFIDIVFGWCLDSVVVVLARSQLACFFFWLCASPGRRCLGGGECKGSRGGLERSDGVWPICQFGDQLRRTEQTPIDLQHSL